MKKLILSFAIMLTLFSTAFANIPEAHNQNAVASFRKEFKTPPKLNGLKPLIISGHALC